MLDVAFSDMIPKLMLSGIQAGVGIPGKTRELPPRGAVSRRGHVPQGRLNEDGMLRNASPLVERRSIAIGTKYDSLRLLANTVGSQMGSSMDEAEGPPELEGAVQWLLYRRSLPAL